MARGPNEVEEADAWDFDAFISYSTAADYRLARVLEGFLESFHRLKNPRNQKLRELSICVDGSDFSMASAQKRMRGASEEERERALERLLEQHLSRARYLVVLCAGPEFESRWQDFELAWWLENRGDDSVFIAVTRGDPSAGPESFFSPRAVAAGLHRRIWFDLRRHAGRKTSPNARDFEEERTRLAAELYGATLQELQPIWFREQRRRTRAWLTAAAVASATFLALAALAWTQRSEAKQQAAIALQQTAETQRQLALAYQEQARQSVIGQEPSRAIQPLVAAREAGLDTPASRMLFAIATRNPQVTSIDDGFLAQAHFDPLGTTILISGSEHGLRRVEDDRHMTKLAVDVNDDDRVIWSPTGRKLLGCKAGHVQVWIADAPRPAAGDVPCDKEVLSAGGFAAFSPGEDRVALRSAEGVVDIIDASTGTRAAHSIEVEANVLGVRFSRDGTVVAIFDDARHVRAWSASTGQAIGPVITADEVVRDVQFGPDLRRLFVLSRKTVTIWNAQTGASLADPIAYDFRPGYAAYLEETTPAAFALSPDGQLFATSNGIRVQIWDATGSHPVELFHPEEVTALAFSPDGTRLATICTDGTLRIWDVETALLYAGRLDGSTAVTDQLETVEFSADGSRVLVGGAHVARVWSALPEPSLDTLAPHVPGSRAGASPTGRLVALADPNGVIQIFDAASGSRLGSTVSHGSTVDMLLFSANDAVLASVGQDLKLRFWDTTTGTELGHALDVDPVAPIVMDRRGEHVAINVNNVVTVWGIRTATKTALSVRVPERHVVDATLPQFDTTGRRLLTPTNGGVQFWSVASGQREGTPLTIRAKQIVLSPDDSFFIAIDDSKLQILSNGGAPLHELRQDRVRSVVFSLDGRRLLALGAGRARVWDLASGRPVTPLMVHVQRNIDIVGMFTPDSSRIVTFADTLRVWDAQTGLALLPELDYSINAYTQLLGTTPDGTRVLLHAVMNTPASYVVDGLVTWTLPTDNRELSQWQAIARNEIVPSPEPSSADQRFAAENLLHSAYAAYPLHPEIARTLASRVEATCRKDCDRLIANTRLFLALPYALSGDLVKARAEARVEPGVDDAALLTLIAASMHDEMGQSALALQLFEQVERLQPSTNKAELYAQQADALFALERFVEATVRARGAAAASKLDHEMRIVSCLIAWSAQHLLGKQDANSKQCILQSLAQLPDGTRLQWSFEGMRRALMTGATPFETASPILDLTNALDLPITKQTGANVAQILETR